MAITNNFGSLLVNTYSTYSPANQTGVDTGQPEYKIATCAIATTDSIGSVYRFCQVTSGDIPTAIRISSTALTAGAVNVGLYTPQTGALVNVNLFAGTVSFASAVTQSDVRFSTLTIATLGQRIYQLLGLATDPKLTYDLCFTSTTAATAAGTLGAQYEFVK